MKQKTHPLAAAIIMALLALSTISCQKFLSEKPDKKLVIPATLADLQALLDHNNMVNSEMPILELVADNFYLLTSSWLTLPDFDRGMFTWQRDNVYEQTFNDWSVLYRKIYTANTVLETLEQIEQTPANATEWNDIKGQALMVRGKSFLYALFAWSQAYDAATANTDMGIPLRLNTDLAETSVRPSVEDSYARVLNDLLAAAPLLPKRGIHPIRASKVNAYGFLARAYLSMRNYTKAGLYADSALQINSSLLNYNSLSTAPTYPIPQFNTETNYYTTYSNVAFTSAHCKIDSLLYASYAINDCRRTLFFGTSTSGGVFFRGSYTNASAGFSGIATDELYLVRAETHARAGNTVAALADLNTLLQNRMKTGTFIPVTATSAADALTKILVERRKELLFRGLRWMDIKRLNKEGAGITPKRILNNITYTLLPNSAGYALPIPEYVIELSGMPQNPR